MTEASPPVMWVMVPQVLTPEMRDVLANTLADNLDDWWAQLLTVAPDAPADGAIQIAVERLRQVSEKGHSQTLDDLYGGGELARAAMGYVWAAGVTVQTGAPPPQPPEWWPWPSQTFRIGGNPYRMLIRAGALIAAELDRLGRLRAERLAEVAPGNPSRLRQAMAAKADRKPRKVRR